MRRDRFGIPDHLHHQLSINQGIFYKDVESVAALTRGIHHQIDSTFIKPVNISLTMANDSLLKKFLAEEEARMNDDSFIEDMRTYLNTAIS